MKNLDFLKNHFEGQDLLIIGGGFSSEDFEFSKLPLSMSTLVLNDSLYFENGYREIEPDFLMYYDANMIRVLDKMVLPNKTKVLGFSGNHWNGTHYGYRMMDVRPAKESHNLAVKAIAMARNVLGFSRIFLIGIDFYTKDVNGKVSSHWQGEKIGVGEKYSSEEHYKTHLANLEKRTDEFKDIESITNVFNCNENSKLKCYAHLMPY